MNLLLSIPAQYRKIAYFVYALAIVVVTAVQVWYGAIPDTGPSPSWTLRALAVLAYIGIPLGLTAGVNVNRVGPPPNPEPGLGVGERGAVSARVPAWIALAGFVILVVVLTLAVRGAL